MSICEKVTDLLCNDDIKIFASSDSKLNRVMTSAKSAMENVGLRWNPSGHTYEGLRVHTTHDASGLRVDGTFVFPTLVLGCLRVGQARGGD